jgi:outer membrane protein assembly factor BamB
MNTKLKLALLFIAMAGAMISCKQNTKKQEAGFVLNGTINGMTTGKVVFSDFSRKLSDTITVVDGKFQYMENYPEPKMLGLEIIHEGFYHMSVFAENTSFTLEADVKNPNDIKVKGGQAQTDMNLSRQWNEDLAERMGLNKLYKEIGSGNVSEKRRKEIQDLQQKYREEQKVLQLKFVKQFPESYYSLSLVRGMCHGVKVEKMEELLSHLSPKLANAVAYKELKAKIEGIKNSDIGLKDFIKNAANVSYKIEKSFAGKTYTGVVYLAKLKNDNVCALKKNGTILIINAKGKLLAQFNANVKGYASAIATDASDNIYVLDVQEKMEKKKVRGRMMQFPTPVGVICTVYSSQGKELRKFNCSENITAAGAKIVDGKLIVSDCKKGRIAFYNATNGALLAKLKDMRPCCGMLDFALNGQNQLIVANLGAFRVQCVDMKGKKLMTFGNRGKSIDEFHGCCNPVSVASLNNGAIVTVEKDPTRVKIFSKDGAKQIQGIDELVKGCSYIPMTVDSKDNLYLASSEKGIMKCVAIN